MFLYDKIQKNNAYIHYKMKDGKSPISYAVQKGRVASVELLLKYGANSNEVIDKEGNTLLMHASSKDMNNIVSRLIKYGVNTDMKNNKNETALDIGKKLSRINIVKILEKIKK